MYEMGLTALTGGIIGVMMALTKRVFSGPESPTWGYYLGVMVCAMMALQVFGYNSWDDPLPWLVGSQLAWGTYHVSRTWSRRHLAHRPMFRTGGWNNMAWRQGLAGWVLGSIPFWLGSPLITPIPGGTGCLIVMALCIMGIESIPDRFIHPSNPASSPKPPGASKIHPFIQSGSRIVSAIGSYAIARPQWALFSRLIPILQKPLTIRSSWIPPRWMTRWAIIRHWRHHPVHHETGQRILPFPMLTPNHTTPLSPDALLMAFAQCGDGYLPFGMPGFWGHARSMAQSEWDMMARFTQLIGIQDGQHIIEMGCGGGGLTLYWGRRFPNAHIIAVTQTNAQTAYVRQRCQKAGLGNITVVEGHPTKWYDGHGADCVILHPTPGYPVHDPMTYQSLRPLIRSGGTLVTHAITHVTHYYAIKDLPEPVAQVLGYWIPHGIIPPHSLLSTPHEGYQWSQTERYNGYHIRRSARAWQQLITPNRHPDTPLPDGVYPALWVLEAIGADPTQSVGMSIGQWQAQ